MRDYHVLSMDAIDGNVTDHGVVLDLKDIPWAGRQLWDSDCAQRNRKYYLYFSLKDKNDVFHLGVAISDRPEGPFVPQENGKGCADTHRNIGMIYMNKAHGS